jgi:hypothetical protein
MTRNFPDKAIKRRLEFAYQHDIDSACWAALTGWAFGAMTFDECFSQGCRPEYTQYPYCGKCSEYFADWQRKHDKDRKYRHMWE